MFQLLNITLIWPHAYFAKRQTLAEPGQRGTEPDAEMTQ